MSLAGLHILLAEDNPTNQLVAVQMLESLGAQVTLAKDGAEALELCERADFDLGLIDIEMPRLSGTEVIRRLRDMSDLRAEMPLIALTAYVMREHREAIDAAGADGVIAKPILSIEQFGRDILALMRRRNGTAADLPKRAAPVAPPAPPQPAARRPAADAPIDMPAYTALAEAIGPETMQELLGKMDRDIAVAGERIGAALDRHDHAQLREATHVLISVAGSLGANRLHNLAQCLNSAAHTGDTAVLSTGGPEILDEIDTVLRFVRTQTKGG